MSARWWWLAWGMVVLVVAMGSRLDVMEVDAAQYAEISRQLSVSNDWLYFHWRGHDYLDKPPLLFWLSALSFKVFGVHTWSYKLPSILFAFAGVFALYRFTLRHHAVEVARTAALMFATTAAFTLMNNDVRCDTILTACIVIAIQQGDAYQNGRAWKHLFGCAFALGFGMLAKGPIGLVAPLLALLPSLVFAKRWSAFRDARVLVVPLILGALLLPMCIGLYEQHGARGLRFYFWEQSFGRVTGENRWKDDSTPLYFLHEVLWLLLPWTLFALLGLWRDLRTWIRSGAQALPEVASICGALGVLVAMSFSQYKLPHYIYPMMPLLCVVAAREVGRVHRWLIGTQNMVMLLALIAAAALCWSVSLEGSATVFILMFALAFAGVLVAWFLPHALSSRGIVPSVITAMVCAIALNGCIYPFLLRLQSNAQAGQLLTARAIAPDRILGFRNGGAALDFYARSAVPWLENIEEMRSRIVSGSVVFTDRIGADELEAAGFVPKQVEVFRDYPVQHMDPGLFRMYQRAMLLQGRERYLLFY